MVYESDFYTTRRPYRTSPAYSTYTTSYTTPSRQIRVLPGLGKVHIVHTYDRIVPYVGHKRLTVVTSPPKVYSTRPSILHKEYDWIENKLRPWTAYSATNRYLNSDSAVRMIYSRYPISGIRYRTVYSNPISEYYNYYRVIRPLTSYDYWWPYRPLSLYSDYYWPSSYRSTLKYLYDELPIYRSLRFQSAISYPLKTDLDYNYCPSTSWYSYYYNYPRYYRPLTTYYSNYFNYYYPRYYQRPLSRYYYLRNYYYDDYDNYTIWSPYRTKLYSQYWSIYRPISHYLNGLSSYYADKLQSIFDDETRSIRAKSASLLRQIHAPVPRASRVYPITAVNRYDDFPSLPTRYSNDSYIHRLLTISPKTSKVEYTTYYTEPIRKYIGQGHLSCVKYGGDRGYNRRHNLAYYEDPVKNDIQLLSYYINKFRQEKNLQAREPTSTKASLALSSSRPSRIFTVPRPLGDSQEIQELREQRAARRANIYATDAAPTRAAPSSDVADAVQAKKRKEEARLAEERILAAEEQARKELQLKKEEDARQAEIARQEELAAQAAAEQAEIERQAKLERQKAKQAEIEEKARKQKQAEEEEQARKQAEEEEEQRRLLEEETQRQQQEEKRRQLEEEAERQRQEEETRKQLLRLEEIARQAEEEKEAELARQAAELAELARQEAELAELEREERELAAKEEEAAQQHPAEQEEENLEAVQQEREEDEKDEEEAKFEELDRQKAELAELARQEAELEELARQEAELAESARQEAELAELAKQEEELAELARQEAKLAELARQEAELEELARQEAELAELERQQAELDALDAEAKALAEDLPVREDADAPGNDYDDEEEDEQAIAEDLPGDEEEDEE